MPHPRNDGGFRSLFNRNSFRPCNRTTSNWRGMIGYDTSEPLSKIGVVGVEGEECYDSSGEVFDVNLLGLFTSLGIGFF